MGQLPRQKTQLEIGVHAITLREVSRFCMMRWSTRIREPDINWLLRIGLLPTFTLNRDQWVFLEDLTDLEAIIRSLDESTRSPGRTLFSPCQPNTLRVNSTQIDLLLADDTHVTALCPAIRRLVSAANQSANDLATERSLIYLSGTRIRTYSSRVFEVASRQIERVRKTENAKSSEFANTAYYMGAKRALGGFIVESIASILGEEGHVVDLMCGSGSVSGACARYWPTLASDSQRFCTLLAHIQGGGFSRQKARELLDEILPKAQSHATDVAGTLDTFLSQEDALLHDPAGPDLLKRYLSFHQSFPTYPDVVRAWPLIENVEERKKDPSCYPYILFTAYFANSFLGLRQAVEVDSLRFAIDQLSSEAKQRWALGALVASVSRLATTYGGHFAQPLVRNWENVTLSKLRQILQKRIYSVIHEFSVRLMDLAKETETVSHPVHILPGPWQHALRELDEHSIAGPVVVYLDPPYKREEYSRYYHPLETLVTYRYPYAEGKGKTPSKKHGERFRSEFFTRSKVKMSTMLAQTISAILDRGWACAWSYSDASAVEVLDVVSRLESDGVRISSYSTPYRHHAQGGRRPLSVTEYLIMLTPSRFPQN